MEVEIENQTVADTSNPGAEESHAEPHVEPKEVEAKEVEAAPKSTKDALDEIVAKVKGKEQAPQDQKQTAAPQAKDSEALPKYTPNYKFTANKKEQEIPEYLRAGIKDKASEKQIRELCEKAYGLDTVKADRDSLHKQFTETSTAHNNLLAGVQSIRSDFQRGDIDSFLQKLKIPEEVMLKWAVQKANYYNASAEERAAFDAQKQIERNASLLETQNSALEAANAQTASRMKQLELNFEFMKPEVSTLEKSVDARFGKPGVLRQMVIDEGARAWVESKGKVNLTPAQALAQVQERYGLKLGEQAKETAPNTESQVSTAGTTAQVQKKPVNTIPNLRGSTSTSPLKSKPRSIEDLKKLAAQQ